MGGAFGSCWSSQADERRLPARGKPARLAPQAPQEPQAPQRPNDDATESVVGDFKQVVRIALEESCDIMEAYDMWLGINPNTLIRRSDMEYMIVGQNNEMSIDWGAALQDRRRGTSRKSILAPPFPNRPFPPVATTDSSRFPPSLSASVSANFPAPKSSRVSPSG